MGTYNHRLGFVPRRFLYYVATVVIAIGIGVIAFRHYQVHHQQQTQSLVRPQSSSQLQANVTHRNITTTEFWVGEPADGDNADISNVSSVWDGSWQQHYGGIDSPSARNGYLPAGFTAHENPFYIALPYSDIDDQGNRKPSAKLCLQVNGRQPSAYSWCKNSWIAISYSDKTVYAQWEDAGPFGEGDTAYVFGAATPTNTTLTKAGIDVSPAVTTYLGLDGLNRTNWHFVRASQVPDGPWKQLVTTSLGEEVN